MTLTSMLLNEAEASYAIAQGPFLKVTDAELAWKPSTGGGRMSVAQLLMHTASFGCGKAVQGCFTGDWGTDADAREQDHAAPVRVR